MPTGVSLRDPREQLFAAAERVLARDGPAALSSRAITAEAGCAKGVLHRHFADVDAFLAELITDRAARVGEQAAVLRAAAGTGTVVGRLSVATTTALGPVARSMLALVTFRDGLRARLRAAGHTGLPILAEITAMVADYLAAERDLGRIAADADVDALTLAVVGAVHLLASGGDGPGTDGPAPDGTAPDGPDPDAVRRVVTTALAGATTGAL